jgi:hypothetical protein
VRLPFLTRLERRATLETKLLRPYAPWQKFSYNFPPLEEAIVACLGSDKSLEPLRLLHPPLSLLSTALTKKYTKQHFMFLPWLACLSRELGAVKFSGQGDRPLSLAANTPDAFAD